ncbi:hypothetical protein IPG41_04875 [Candidatus Peregrinibacteria bacterium]|nr:MAG: hypothetical protein IPG41_04875 [Candidatus Peregrinibacteria bacterium]
MNRIEGAFVTLAIAAAAAVTYEKCSEGEVEMVIRTEGGDILRTVEGGGTAFYERGQNPCVWVMPGQHEPAGEIIPLPPHLEGEPKCKLILAIDEPGGTKTDEQILSTPKS